MTTAARPTFDTARGGATARDKNAPIRQIAARDLTAHTTLKYRQPGQGGEVKDKEELKAELKRAEKEHYRQVRKEKGLPELAEDDNVETNLEIEGDGGETLRVEAGTKNIDADDSDDDESDDSSDDSDDDNDEDDTAALLLELEKIKRERAEERERQEREQAAHADAEREEEAATGNPLLDLSNSTARDFSVKRRWDDDVIFKNQARGVDEKPKKRFINDTLRSDFHKKFMSKYIQ